MIICLIACSVIVTSSIVLQTVLMYGIVNHLRAIREERLLVQKVVSNERWI